MPEFSVIIASAGEDGAVLAHKIDNTLALQGSEAAEILLFSDGHALNPELSRNGRVQLCEFKRQGKTECQNQCAERATGEILLFTDVTADLDEHCLKRLSECYQAPAVAAVGGHFSYRFASANTEGAYLSSENRFKMVQSGMGTVIGYFGPLYSVRKACYQPMPGFYCSDLMLPILVINQGKRAVLNPQATSWRFLERPVDVELERKRRIVAQAASSVAHFLWRNWSFPLRHPIAFAFLMTFKILRWLAPPLILALWIALVVWQPLWGLASAGVCIAAIGLSLLATRILPGAKLLHIPYYVYLVCAGGILGLFDALRGERYTDWEPGRR